MANLKEKADILTVHFKLEQGTPLVEVVHQALAQLGIEAEPGMTLQMKADLALRTLGIESTPPSSAPLEIARMQVQPGVQSEEAEPTANREAAAAWLLLIRQTHPTYLIPPQTAWRLYNSSDPNGDNYSILETLDDSYRMLDGKFKFKLVYPRDNGYVTWRQRSNPMTSAEKSIEGVEFLDSKGVTTGFKHHNDFCGLRSGAKSEHYGSNWAAMMNGSTDGYHWSYAVGSGSKWGRGIPASCNGGHSRVEATTQVELYVWTSNWPTAAQIEEAAAAKAAAPEAAAKGGGDGGCCTVQ